jgi:hypothetical protein
MVKKLPANAWGTRRKPEALLCFMLLRTANPASSPAAEQQGMRPNTAMSVACEWAAVRPSRFIRRNSTSRNWSPVGITPGMSTDSEASVLDRILNPVSRCLTPDVARALVALRVDAETQTRIDELADKCTEGRLSPEERAEYADYISAINFVTILQSKARVLLTGSPDAAR